jgi:hypothetical protein
MNFKGDDDLGTAIDIAAGPLFGAAAHTPEFFEKTAPLRHWGDAGTTGWETAMSLATNEFEFPFASAVSGGLIGAEGINKAVHGDLSGGALSAMEGNGGILSTLFGAMYAD